MKPSKEAYHECLRYFYGTNFDTEALDQYIGECIGLLYFRDIWGPERAVEKFKEVLEKARC